MSEKLVGVQEKWMNEFNSWNEFETNVMVKPNERDGAWYSLVISNLFFQKDQEYRSKEKESGIYFYIYEFYEKRLDLLPFRKVVVCNVVMACLDQIPTCHPPL